MTCDLVCTLMSSYSDSRLRTAPRKRHEFPAYGPVDAVLGLLLFYYLVDRATPTVVAVLTESTLSLSPSLVRFGLAAFVWFVLAVTVLEQVRRQLASLGIGRYDANRSSIFGRKTPTETQALVALVAVLVFGLAAAWTFESAVSTAMSMIRVVATLDAGAFVPGEFAVMVVFFISFSLASKALDRLLVGGFRMLFTEYDSEPA
ncbi:hypothetical protein GJ632_07280 [Halogeometricum sp. CBA1124]|nr:hypothetical protein [Halogeometricum sp. CBA1124]